MLWVLAPAALELRAGCAGRKELSQQLDSAPSPHLPSTLLTRNSFHMFCSSCLVCALSSERGQSWQGAGFVVFRDFPVAIDVPGQGWEERADRKRLLDRKAALPGKAD